MGVGDLDVVFLELVPDEEVDLAADEVGLLVDGPAPDAEFEVQRGVAEFEEAHGGRGILQHVLAFGRRFEQRLLHHADVAVVMHADRQAEPGLGVGVAPVGDGGADEFGVGHDHGDVVVGDHGRAAQADLGHLARNAGHLDAVAQGDRPLRQDDDAADEIVDDVLQAEADAHTDGSCEEGEGAQVDPDELQGDVDADDQQEVTEHPRDRILEAQFEAGAAQQAADDVTAQEIFPEEDAHDQRGQGEDAAQGDLGLAHRKEGVIQDLFEFDGKVLHGRRHD